MGQPVYCSAAYAHKWRERGYGAGSTPYTWFSSIAFLPWLPNFPLQAFPPTIFSLTSPWLVSLQSTAALTLDFSTVPRLQLPATLLFRGPAFLPWGVYGCSKDCLIPILFRLPQISCFTLSLKCFSSDSDNCPDVGIGLLLQLPTHQGQVLSY